MLKRFLILSLALMMALSGLALAEEAGANPLIEVDGGMGVKTAGLVASCGADVLVAGNAVFGAPDPAVAIAEITAAAEAARREADIRE